MSSNIVVTESIGSDQSQNYNYNYNKWSLIPEPVLIGILNYLSSRNILNVGECCRRWNDISQANYLWKRIFQRDFRVDKKIELKPGKYKL